MPALASSSGTASILRPAGRASSPGSSGPNPGTPSGAVKSHAFSASPTKSRIAGSATPYAA